MVCQSFGGPRRNGACTKSKILFLVCIYSTLNFSGFSMWKCSEHHASLKTRNRSEDCRYHCSNYVWIYAKNARSLWSIDARFPVCKQQQKLNTQVGFLQVLIKILTKFYLSMLCHRKLAILEPFFSWNSRVFEPPPRFNAMFFFSLLAKKAN